MIWAESCENAGRMDEPSLSGPRAKYRRAKEHIDALHREIVRFTHDNPDPKIEHFDKETGRYTLAIKTRDEPDAERWGILLGDAVHNLRGVLDHIVWQLVLLNGEKPGRHNHWPAATTRERYWCRPKNGSPSLRESALRGVAEGPRAVIDGLQPYRAGPQMNQHLLQLLIPLSNADKHRVVQAAVLASLGPPDELLARNEDVGNVIEGTFAVGPLDEHANVVDCRFEITGPNPHVQMHGNLTVVVGFGQQGFAWNAIVGMVPVVGQTIDAFQHFFEAQETKTG